MSPIIIDKENKKKEILQAATLVFSRKGIPNTNMIDIAREAGIGKGTIYEYFRSKEEIITETFRNFISQLNMFDLKTLAQKENEIDKLIYVVDVWMDTVINAPAEFKVIVDFWADAARQREEDRIEELSQLYVNYREFLKAIIDEGIEKGTIRKMDATIMASIIAGALDGITLHWIMNMDLFDMHSAVEMYKLNLELVLKPD